MRLYEAWQCLGRHLKLTRVLDVCLTIPGVMSTGSDGTIGKVVVCQRCPTVHIETLQQKHLCRAGLQAAGEQPKDAEEGEGAQEAEPMQEPSSLNRVIVESPEEPTAPAPSAVEHFNGVGGIRYPGKTRRPT